MVSLALIPYVRSLRRVLAGRGSIEDIAFKKEVLCEEQVQANAPPVFLPGQIDRITGASEHLPLRVEIESMLADRYVHAPTVAYHIRNAALVDGAVYVGNYKHFIATRELFNSQRQEVDRIRVGALASSPVGTRYFGHWARDDCLQYMLAERVGQPLCARTPSWHHKQKYAEFFRQDWRNIDRAFIDNLIIYQDHGQNDLKRSRYLELRSRIRAVIPAHVPSEIVYLRRGKTGVSRIIENEEALLRDLSEAGVSVVGVDEPLTTILAVLASAKIVISMEGSHITHCCFGLSEKSGLIVLQPPERFAAVHRHWSLCVGVQFGFVVGEAGALGSLFSACEILQTVELLSRQMNLARA